MPLAIWSFKRFCKTRAGSSRNGMVADFFSPPESTAIAARGAIPASNVTAKAAKKNEIELNFFIGLLRRHGLIHIGILCGEQVFVELEAHAQEGALVGVILAAQFITLKTKHVIAG